MTSTEDKTQPSLRWGVGIEHEMHVRTARGPLSSVSRTFLVNNILERLEKGDALPSEFDVLTEEDRAFLRSGAVDSDLELSGRTCAGLSGPKEKMFELITRNFLNVTFPEALHEMQEIERRFLAIATKVAREPVEPYPYGSAVLEISDARGKTKSYLKDYTGSYHITVTLPHDPAMPPADFVAMHRKMACLFQWMEPLLIGTLATPDPNAPGQGRQYPRGSMRINRFGWGTPGCSDVRKLEEGIGRRANHVPEYLGMLKFKNTPDYTKTCYLAIETNPSRKLKVDARKVGGLRTDIRTFGIEKQGVRVNMGNYRGIPVPRFHVRGFWNKIKVSGAPMTTGYGVELRIFDHFPSAYLAPVLCLLALLAEASTRVKADRYVQESTEWNYQVKHMMECGSFGKVLDDYYHTLRDVLGLSKSMTVPRTIAEGLQLIHKDLLRTYRTGEMFQRLWGKTTAKKPCETFPNHNAAMWGLFYKEGLANRARRDFWVAVKALGGGTVGTKISVADLAAQLPKTWDHYDLAYAVDAELQRKTLKVSGKDLVVVKRAVLSRLPKQPVRCEPRASDCSLD